MTTLTVALLNAAYNGDGARENFSRDVPADLEQYDATEGDLPDHDAVDAAVVTGSKASTYWDEPWIDALRSWLREADAREMPLFGVCFGHQIVADALGGAVDDMGEYELGYHTVDRTDESPLFDGIDEEFVAFCTHHDEVTDLPPGADLIARNECAIQGFRRGNAFGVQFHPEFDRDTAERVASGKDLPEAEVDAALATITDERVAAADRTKRVFGNFLRYAESVAEGPAAADD
jgi:GMP synthase (glutamine-hydrolysing)